MEGISQLKLPSVRQGTHASYSGEGHELMVAFRHELAVL